MDNDNETKRYIINQKELPKFYPTHRHSPQFWERLGRTIATFGFLEEVLGKAIFVYTATRQYKEIEIDEAYKAWLPTLGKALSDSLRSLADSYCKAVKTHQAADLGNIDQLIDSIKKASEIRNVLCHGSWRVPDSSGKSLPLFVNTKNEIFETPIDIEFLDQIQAHVQELSCLVIDSVTKLGFRFPGSSGPGKVVWI